MEILSRTAMCNPRTQGPHVISSVARNLVLYRNVALFHGTLHFRKGAIWVLKDEISHYVRNDMVGLWVLRLDTFVLEIVT
jgi:hypothetical protein